jgi:Tol biopolymer transport system component
MDAAGNTSALRSKSSAWGAPRVAPDGRRIALAINDGKQTDVWVYEWERDTLTRITSDPGSDVGPIWSPDSRWIAFASVRAGRPGSEVLNLYAQRADGTGDAIRLTDSPESQVPGSWHPNAKVIAFHEGSPGRGRQNIMTLALEGDSAAGWKPGHTSVFVGGPFLKARPSFSPDGRWLAYTETASGGWEVYVRPFPGPGGRWQVSSGGGLDPVWSLVKNEILFRSGGTTGRLWAAPYSYEGDEFRPGKPAPWTPSPIGAPTLGLSLGRIFDLHPDGKRVAVALPAQASPEAGGDKVVVVLNFFDELRRLAPRKTSP